VPVTDRRILVLAWRALLTAARTPALWAAVGVQIAFYAVYMLQWGTGLPLAGARTALDQFATVQWVFLGLALPWTAARSGAGWRRDDVAQLAALGGVPPSSIVTATVGALAVVLLATAIAGLPFALLAQQISALPSADLWRTQLPLYALSLFTAPVAAACMLVVAGRYTAWLIATALTIVAMLAVPPGLAGDAVLVTAGAAVAAMLVSGADQRFWYLSEQTGR
jgi:hypothetical protein